MSLQSPTTAWNAHAEDYCAIWPDLNRDMIRQAIDYLPVTTPPKRVHLAGAGAGHELPLVRARFPQAIILATDIAPNLLRRIEVTPGQNHHVWPVVASMESPPILSVDLAMSFFVLHLVKDPIGAALAQLKTVESGGAFTALYFPPVPRVDGPLAGFFRAMTRKLDGRKKPDWEPELIEALQQQGADVTLHEIRSTWTFDTPEGFRSAMECLPHIAGIQKRSGSEFYEALWDEWAGDPGLEKTGDGWSGPVAASLLIAQR